MPAVQPSAQQFDFYKYLRILWRRKWLLLVPLAICVPTAIVLAWQLPTEYQSKAVLEFSENLPAAESRFQRHVDVNRELKSVHTRMLSWQAVRDVVLSRKVNFGQEVDPDDRRQIERIYHMVQRRSRLSAVGPRHLSVVHKSTSHEKNATLVNELVKRFVGEDRRQAQEQAKTDLKYYNEKLAAAKAHLDEIDNQLREFDQANTWLGDDLAELNRDYEDAQEEELTVRREIAECEARIEDLNKELAKEKPEIVETRTVPASPELQAARKTLEKMKEYFGSVNDRYTPAHRHWQDAKRRLAEAQAKVDELAKDGGGETEDETKPNPKYEQVKRQIDAEEKRLGHLQQRRLVENKKVSDLYVKVRRAPELLGQKRSLMENREQKTDILEDYEKGRRNADKNLQRLMTEAYSSKFRVVEYARPDETPVKDTKLKVVALGLLLGLLTGVGLIALLEYLDQTFKTIDDARAYLGLPALGVIPAIFTPRDHRRQLWFRVLAVSSAVFVIGVGVAIYLLVPKTQETVGGLWSWFRQQTELW